MKFMKNLSQKKLVKAVVCGLLVSGGMFAGMGQAYAKSSAVWISGAERHTNGWWTGKAGTEVRVTTEKHTGAKSYDGGKIFGENYKGGGKVTVDGGTYNNSIYGGHKTNNTLNIIDGTFNADVYGGSDITGGNTVTISGGTFNCNIAGCNMYIKGYTKGSTINLIGEGGRLKIGESYIANKRKISVNGRVCGYEAGGDDKESSLNVAGKNIYAKYLQNFLNMNFYINNTVKNGDTLLQIEGEFIGSTYKSQALDLEHVTIKAGVENGSALKVGDKVTLIESKLGIQGLNNTGKLEINDFQDYDLKYEIENKNKLNAIITSELKPKEGADSPVKSPVETQAAGLTMLTTGADMLAGQGFDSAASAVASEAREGGSANSLTPFVTVGGAKTRVNSGSHIDVNGWHLNVGLAKELKNKSGKLLIGPVVEYGKGSYDSYLDNGFHGEGDTRYIGGGVMAKQTNDNGFYYEGSLRAGKLSNDYKSQDNSFNKYDSDSTYYAAHVGLGKILKLNDKNSLDYYGKYFYTHQKGDDATLYADGEPIAMRFDSVDSSRTRIGARFTHALSEKNSIYAGLAWQHEFSGTARATMDGTGTPAPSVKGNTGIMELGWKVEAGKKLDLDLNATGYTGKQKGASLNLAVNFKF